MGKNRFIQVILPLKLDWRPFYAVSEELMAEAFHSHPSLFEVQESDNQDSTLIQDSMVSSISIKIGTRVRVCFARKTYVGIVCGNNVVPPESLNRILEINEIATDLEPVSKEELELWEFLSEYYLCTIGEVYKTAYPGLKIKQEQIAARLQERESARIAKATAMLDRKILRLEERISKREEALTLAKKESRIALLKEEIRELDVQLTKALAEKEQLVNAPETGKGNYSSGEASQQSDIQLSPAQEKAFEKITAAFGHNKIVLLNGVTGSGKTEIYIRLAEETLRQGRNVLYLVPEILMGNQLAHRLKQIFGKRLLSFNSSQTTAERYHIAEQIQEKKNNQGYIVLGTRSAIFLPHHDLGLIIIDEEHDTSYKQQDSNPRYNGRDAGIVLGQIFHSHVLLGSATPSLESIYNCETGRYEEVILSEKYYDAESADVQVIDTIAERRKRGMKGLFSIKLIQQIQQTLDHGEQVVILRSRRAYSPIVQCENCGHIPHCPHCNVTLSYHKANGKLICHYCGYSQPYTRQCPSCGGHLEPMGSGTQKVEEEARALFPTAAIARLDSDTVSSKTYLNRTLDDFYQGKINLLIGTQIVAKGLDFPHLSLVVMLQADAMLGMEDFRADERALQLLEQFRGRCARRNQKGRFIIQTSQPAHPIYQQMLGKNPVGMPIVEHFLEERKTFNYPPYTRAIHIIIKDSNEKRLDLLSDQLYTYLCKGYGLSPAFGLNGAQNKSVQIIPPFSPVIDKISNEFIRHIRISLRRDRSLNENKNILHRQILQFETEKKYPSHITLDVDPL